MSIAGLSSGSHGLEKKMELFKILENCCYLAVVWHSLVGLFNLVHKLVLGGTAPPSGLLSLYDNRAWGRIPFASVP